MRIDRLKEDGTAIAFLFGLAGLYFLHVLLKGNSQVLSVIGADTWNQFFYWRAFGYNTLARGEIPLWNPYIFSGTPYIAGIQSALFYPLNILFLFLDVPLAINSSVALHCFLGSVFMYLFARYMEIRASGSVLSAVAFAYGAPYFFHIYPGHLSNLSTMIWLPLIFLGLEAWLRKKEMVYALMAGVALAMQVFAGHPQYLFYSAIAASLYFFLSLAIRRELRPTPYLTAGFGVFLITGVLLSAVQLLPALELARHSVRAALTYDWVSAFSLPPETLMTLVLPDFFGDMMSVPYWGKNYLWEMSVYFGLIPLALAVVGIVLDRSRIVVLFSWLAAAALVLALGKHTPLLTVLYRYAPGFQWFSGVSKFIFIFAFAGSLIAGYGLQKIADFAQAQRPSVRSIAYTLVFSSAALAFLGWAFWYFGADLWKSLVSAYVRTEDRYHPAPPLNEEFLGAARRLVFESCLRSAALLSPLGAALLLSVKFPRHAKRLVELTALVLAVLDLWSFGARYLVTFDSKLAPMDQELKAFLKRETEPFRVATPFVRLLNVGLLEGIENVGGYDANVLRNYSEFINWAQGRPLDDPNLIMTIRRASPMLDLLNVKYYIVPPQADLEVPALEPAFGNSRFKVYRNKSSLPRSFIVHDAWVIRGREAILRKLASPDFDPTEYAIVEESIAGLSYGRAAESPRPRIVGYSPNRVSLEAHLQGPGLLVLADAYDPGWRAWVDDQEAKVYRANYVMRAVFLPGGNHRIEFRYEPGSFKLGALISLMSLVLMVGWWVVALRFRARDFHFWRRSRKHG